MKIASLIEGLPIVLAGGSGGERIDGITEDSRRVRPGDLFIARPGTRADGHDYIRQAIASGATAVLASQRRSVPGGTAALVPADRSASIAALGAALAERLHGEPGAKLDVVGITGTNGKTTVAHLVHQLLSAAGTRAGLIGTVHVDAGRGLAPATLTTPSAVELSGLLAAMVDAECRAAVIEVSSHALEQRRVAAIRFGGAVFTNLSGDHLDYHGSMEKYLEAKGRLFEMLPASGWAVINADDPVAISIRARCDARIIDCSLLGRRAECAARVRRRRPRGTEVELTGPWGRIDLTLPLVGEHNVMNALQAAAAAHELGLDVGAIETGLFGCTAPPGRLEPVTAGTSPFTVLVDYAHTDDALENVLRAVRPLVHGGGNLRVVFGCGGDRDATKRPRMAAAAWHHADEVIITSDNPRSEDPDAIIDDAFRGVPSNKARLTARITDRRAAIEAAIERCAPGDLVVIAGKGHEDYQIVGTDRHPFDDRVVAREALARR